MLSTVADGDRVAGGDLRRVLADSQAIQLGYCPRMKILHTSATRDRADLRAGVNWMLLFVILVLVIGFRSSDNLAAAYGIAVTATMVITTILVFVVMRQGVELEQAAGRSDHRACSCTIDLAFFGAKLLKIAEGGWLPLVIGAVAVHPADDVEGRTHREGAHGRRTRCRSMLFLQGSASHIRRMRVPGTAIFLTGSDAACRSLLHNLKHNKVLHERTCS